MYYKLLIPITSPLHKSRAIMLSLPQPSLAAHNNETFAHFIHQDFIILS